MLSSPPRAKDVPNRMCHQHTLLYTTPPLTPGQTTLSQEQTLRRAEKGRNEEGKKGQHKAIRLTAKCLGDGHALNASSHELAKMEQKRS